VTEPLFALAIDPGSHTHACARLRFDAPSTITFLDFSLCDLGGVIPFIAKHDGWDLATLEVIEGYAFNPARVKDMVLTARNEGRIIEQLYGAGFPPVTCSAGEARGHLGRSAQMSDKQVAIVVEDLVKGAPTAMRKAERQHVYDACIYGCYGLVKRGARLTLSSSAELALMKQRAEERAKSAAKGKRTKAKRVR
jgi:hypothetical protein